jgi:hypothetical protein
VSVTDGKKWGMAIGIFRAISSPAVRLIGVIIGTEEEDHHKFVKEWILKGVVIEIDSGSIL